MGSSASQMKTGLISQGPMLARGNVLQQMQQKGIIILLYLNPFFRGKQSSKPSFTQTKSDLKAMIPISKKDQKKLAPFSWGLCAWRKGHRWQVFEFHSSKDRWMEKFPVTSCYIQCPHGLLSRCCLSMVAVFRNQNPSICHQNHLSQHLTHAHSGWARRGNVVASQKVIGAQQILVQRGKVFVGLFLGDQPTKFLNRHGATNTHRQC